MSKKTLTGTFTAPAELLKPEETLAPVATQDDYKKQAYRRELGSAGKTYKERMTEVLELREKRQKELEEPPRKKLHSEQIELTDELLDKILPPGYIKVDPPEEYQEQAVDVYIMPDSGGLAKEMANDTSPEYQGLAMQKEDVKHLGVLLRREYAEISDPDERKFFRAAELVFKAKNGPQAVRKKAVRGLSSNTSSLGAKAVFGVILPLLLEPDLAEQDRHLLTKLCQRAVHQLDDQIRPFTHQIVSAVGPMLIDEDLTLRLEARNVISGVSRAAGLANLVAVLRPDLDHTDEYVRNLTARVFAVVALTLGLVKTLPFVRAVIRSKSPQARHTGIRIVHHICVASGGGNGATILPYLAGLLDVLKPGLTDELLQVRTATANTISLLADSVSPYGIEAFEGVLEATWAGLKQHRGRSLAAYLRALGSTIPLMAHNAAYEEYANFYARELMHVMTREFHSPDDDMKKAILRVLATMPVLRAVFPNFRKTVTGPFFQSFWTRRVALDASQTARLVVEATCRLARQLDVAGFLAVLTPLAKDANEMLRRMAADAIAKIVSADSASLVELDDHGQSALIDAVLVAFQEQTEPHPAYLSSAKAVCSAMGLRLQPHVAVILSTVLFRMKNQDPEVRLQAADLTAALAPEIQRCSGEATMKKLVLFLYELLGEVYPEVLGSIVGALHGCIDALDTETILSLDNPLMNMLLPTLTPILKNRHEKVQEQCIRLVGLIAQKNAELINAKEWMRVCFDLLDMLKSPRKRIRVAANATFGHIANTIGPQDVLAMLLNNLRVQERQMRVCTAVAIGIVADTCSPFTVLPALMNEYRVPERNVRTGVLKALSFLFEYISGSDCQDYLFAITPLLDDALTDRDQVHRQTAATVVRHIALNCAGLAHDDVFVHYLNLVLPNIYELLPHVIIRIIEAVDALRLALGPAIFLNYIWAGLFHPARKVRAPFWKVYNLAYIHNCDALVPFYPRFDALDERYNVEELDIWL